MELLRAMPILKAGRESHLGPQGGEQTARTGDCRTKKVEEELRTSSGYTRYAGQGTHLRACRIERETSGIETSPSLDSASAIRR